MTWANAPTGAAAAAIATQTRLRQRDAAIRRQFKTEQDQRHAWEVLRLLERSREGGTGFVIAGFFLSLATALVGWWLSDPWGDFARMVGSLVGLFIGVAIATGANYCFARRPARRQLQAYLSKLPDGEQFGARVRQILDRVG